MSFAENGAMHVYDDNVKFITNINQATISLNNNHYIDRFNGINAFLNAKKEPLMEFSTSNTTFNKTLLTEHSIGNAIHPFLNLYSCNLFINSNVDVKQKLNDIDNTITKIIEDFFYEKPRLPLSTNITLQLTSNSPNQLIYNLNEQFSGTILSYNLIENSSNPINVAKLHGNWLKIYPTTERKSIYTIETTATNTIGTNNWKIKIIESV
jgi:hypothetical protein